MAGKPPQHQGLSSPLQPTVEASRSLPHDSEDDHVYVPEDNDKSSTDSRYVGVVILSNGPPTPIQTILVDNTTRYIDVERELANRCSGSISILQATYGPRPYWVVANPEALIGHPFQPLYAINLQLSMGYVLAMVRTTGEDWPLVILESPADAITTISDAIASANWNLAGKRISITDHSSARDVEEEVYDYQRLVASKSPHFPTVFFITVGSPSHEFKLDESESSIPAFLQILFVQCRTLLQQTYGLKDFPLQVIHVASALLHAVISLARAIDVASRSNNMAGETYSHEEDILSIAPVLLTRLEQYLHRLKAVIETIKGDAFDPLEIQQTVGSIFIALCGDHPGAVTIRSSHFVFEELKVLDWENYSRRVKTQQPLPGLAEANVSGRRPERIIADQSKAHNTPVSSPALNLQMEPTTATAKGSLLYPRNVQDPGGPSSRSSSSLRRVVVTRDTKPKHTTKNQWLTKNADPLTQVLSDLVPPDEDPVAQANHLALEQEAYRVSEEIDERLRLERLEKKNKRIVKILLLGQSESGKSTTLKNIQLCYAPQSLRQEAYAWRIIIHLNLLRSIQIVMDTLYQADRENVPIFTDELRRLLLRLSPLKQAEELLKMKISIPLEEEGDSRIVLANSNEFSVRSASGWKQAFNKMRGVISSKDDNRFDDVPANILEACLEDMIAIWDDPTTKKILKQRRIRVEESSGFFLNDIERIANKAYLPTDDDILRARLRTVGVQEHKLSLELGPERGQDWYIYDVGGSRSQRSAWESFFDDVNAIIFLAPLAAFDQSLAEDRHINRVEDSLLSWKSICSSKLLARVELILFLNKCDLLAKKLDSGVELAQFVPSFRNHPNNLETVTKYFRAKFKAIQKEYSPTPRTFYGHLTSVTDARSTASIVTNIHEVIFKANLHSANTL